ncbi:unnamed protein product [Calypogeia fissa]
MPRRIFCFTTAPPAAPSSVGGLLGVCLVAAVFLDAIFVSRLLVRTSVVVWWSAQWSLGCLLGSALLRIGGLLGGRLMVCSVVCSGTRLQLDGSGGALGGMFCSWVVSGWSPWWCSVLPGQLTPSSAGLLCLACSSASLQLIIKVATRHSAAARRQARGLRCRSSSHYLLNLISFCFQLLLLNLI